MSKPIRQFNETVVRANALLDIYVERQQQFIDGSAAETIKEDDLIRASVVMSVAAMDHYFTSKFTDILVLHLKSQTPSEELIDVLRRSGIDTRAALELSMMKRPFRRIRTKVQNHLSHYTSHRADAIDKLFRSIGLHGLCGRAQAKIGKKGVLKRIDNFVLIRNQIAHSGHLNSRGKAKVILHKKVQKQIFELDEFVKACDLLISDFAKSSLIEAS